MSLINPYHPTGPSRYCVLVSAATALAEKGATALQLQMFGGWKSIAVAEGYIRESAKTKKDIALLLSSNAASQDTTSQDTTSQDAATPDAASKEAIQDPPADLVLDEHQPKLNRVLLIMSSQRKPIVQPKLWVALLTKPSISITVMVVSCIFDRN
ncbi:hypothetical protein ACTFIZ_004837 [Dictyostelium cf. discoideum]